VYLLPLAGIPAFTFVEKFGATVFFMLIASAVVTAAVGIRWAVAIRHERRMHAAASVMHLTRMFEKRTSAAVLQVSDSESSCSRSGSKRALMQAATLTDEPLSPQVRDDAEQAECASINSPFDVKEDSSFIPPVSVVDSAHTPRARAARRLRHALIILLTIFFLRLTLLQMETFECFEFDVPQSAAAYGAGSDSTALIMLIDLQTRCYTGSHLGISIASALFFILYTIGFPLTCFILLTRSLASKDSTGLIGVLWRNCRILRAPTDDEADGRVSVSSVAHSSSHHADTSKDDTAQQKYALAASEQSSHAATSASDEGSVAHGHAHEHTASPLVSALVDTIGFLTLGFKHEHYPHCLMTFLVSVSISMTVTSTSLNSALRLFGLGLTYGVCVLSVTIFMPYLLWRNNVIHGAIGIASLVSAEAGARG
jgi:hypothetical protein